MAIEDKRGCGYRKVGGVYIEGEYTGAPCDRLPLPITSCPVCGSGVHVNRGVTRIIPVKLFGYHQPCEDKIRPCFVCDPPEDPGYIMLVGEMHYKTPADFMEEGLRMGISKRLPSEHIPKDLIVGKTVVYLAHRKAVEVREAPADQKSLGLSQDPDQERLIDAESVKKALGIFAAFIPKRIVQIVRESELEGKSGELLRESLEKRGIVPVPVPDGDPDHDPKRRK